MEPSPPKLPLVFFRQASGDEPVREWLKELPEADRRAVGLDLMRVQFRWPVGMPLCRAMGQGLWEVRCALPSSRIARVLFCPCDGRLVALHAFVKKTQSTPAADLALARQRMKELMA
jgi:phage-related protein